MSIDYFKYAAGITRAHAAKVARRARSTLAVEFDDGFTVEATYHLEGSYYAATETSPAERPVAVIDECHVACGDFRAIAPFELLAEHVRERVLDAIAEEEDADE